MSGFIFMRVFDFVKIVKMGASLCEQCVTRLHLTLLSFGDRLTSIAYALLFALSKNSFTSLCSHKTSHWLLLFGRALSRIFLEQYYMQTLQYYNTGQKVLQPIILYKQQLIYKKSTKWCIFPKRKM